jgi:formylglycine-generating enzyme required for sulfatase activity
MLKPEKTSAPASVAAPSLSTLPTFMPTVTVPAGEFLMGISDDQVRYLLTREDWAREWYDHDLFMVEQPQHLAMVAAFAIGLHPVTNAQYKVFVWETGHRTPRGWMAFDPPAGMDDHPVVHVAWTDAVAFCGWLTKATGQPFRLPTEAEWERAARDIDGRIYPWGRDFDPWRCNTIESGKRGTTQIKSYSPGGDSVCGATDMCGNVWEWTASLLRSYPYQADDGREGPKADGPRVARGGAWYYSRKLARCTSREGLLPNYVSPALGFRVALSLA